MCGYFLNATSESPIFMTGHLIDTNITGAGEALIMRTLPLTSLMSKEPLYGNGSINFKSLRNTLMDILIISASQDKAGSVHQRTTPIAQECVLSWCVKTIASFYDHGVYQEDVIESHMNTTSGPFPWVAYTFENDYENGTDIFYLQDINIAGTTSDQRTFSGYGTSNSTAASVMQGFIDLFPSFTTINRTSLNPVMRYKTYRTGPAYTRLLRFNPWLAPNNVSTHMERLAIAMTNAMRSSPSSTMLAGKAYSVETYVAVHWSWLAFPFILLFLGLIFLVATILKTSKEGAVGIWKTSAMPSLIYGLPQEVQASLQQDDHVRRKRARKITIRLLPERGWRLSRQLVASHTPVRRSRIDEPADSV
jgi:hypothetical protein